MEPLRPGIVDLRDIRQSFYRCLRYDKTKEGCQIPNVRVHSIDLRWNLSDPIMKDLVKIWTNTDYAVSPDMEPADSLDAKNYLVTNLIPKFFNTYGSPREISDRLLFASKIWKQYSTIANVDTQSRIIHMWMMSALRPLEALHGMLKTLSSEKMIEQFRDVYFWSRAPLLAVMDVYAIARIFRSFSDGAPDLSNVIIYAGDQHAHTMRAMLQGIFDFDTVVYRAEDRTESSYIDSGDDRLAFDSEGSSKCLRVTGIDIPSIFNSSYVAAA
jgi:hypothetical protein